MHMENFQKKVYRSRKNRVIAGVCGGLGEYFNIDPLIFRIVFVALTLADGAGLLIYIVMALILPNGEQPAGHMVEPSGSSTMKGLFENKRNMVALLIIFVGVIALLNAILPFQWFRWDFFWPIVVIAIGLGLIIKKRN